MQHTIRTLRELLQHRQGRWRCLRRRRHADPPHLHAPEAVPLLQALCHRLRLRVPGGELSLDWADYVGLVSAVFVLDLLFKGDLYD